MKQSWVDRVKERMKVAGVSQEVLAGVLGCTRGAVGHYLAGRRNPTLAQLEKIAGVLQLNPRWMVFGGEEHGVRETSWIYQSGGTENSHVPISGTTGTGPGERRLGTLNLAACLNSAYALVVEGTAWAPRIHEGEIILLCPERNPVPGDELWVSFRDGQIGLRSLVRLQDDRVILDSLTDRRERWTRRLGEIEFMHCVVAVFRS